MDAARHDEYMMTWMQQDIMRELCRMDGVLCVYSPAQVLPMSTSAANHHSGAALPWGKRHACGLELHMSLLNPSHVTVQSLKPQPTVTVPGGAQQL